MRKTVIIILSLMLSMSMMAQKSIQLRSVDKAECVKSDMTSLKASFSFSSIEAQDYPSERGTFSWLSLANTVIGGNVGDPQVPVVNELIAVPFGATPHIEITSYSTTDYRLEDYDIHTLVPRQPSLRKDKRPEDVPFVYNEAAYQSTRGFRNEPMAVVEVVGTMRGVRLGKMTIEPVSYDPVNNILRVFNDIEVEVRFDGADAAATEKMLVDTYSPYFDIVYKQLFNGRAVLDAYTEHPDLYTTPVKMLVVTTSTYANSTPFQNWLTWKKQKGIYVDVQTVANNATASTIKNLIYSRYNANHPTFLVIVGDETVVTYYQLWNYGSNYGKAATDLEYASVDGDVYHDMFISRMPVSSTTELGNLVSKILTYEQYTMSDPSYLNNVLLIAGADNTWAPKVGRPTINYAANYYFNAAHGYANVYKYVTNTYTGCYNYLSSGVGFANYTAHGDIQEWYSPNFTNSDVNNLTNNDKYFWAMGNCCLTCNFKNAQNNQTCFGEAMVRAANKGAFGYIGSVPESYWYEDYYFGVGATTVLNQTPTQAQTQTGVYDAMFDDTGFNTLNSVPYIGNVAVSYAHANNFSSDVSDEYYWRAYQCFGDGSVMPYHTQPSANNVSHASTLGIGMPTFTVNADAGSYVSITVNNEIIGVAQVGTTGTVSVPITPQNTAGTAMIVVTRNQRQPYINTIQIVGGAQYTITTTANPAEAGTVTGGGLLYENTTCTLTAVANSGYDFVNWNDGNIENPRNFTVTGNASFIANFTTVPERSINMAPVTGGAIVSDHTTAYKNDLITLTATPASGYIFDGWMVFKADDINTTIEVSDNTFVMPNYDVTVFAIFTSFSSNNQTIGSGTGTSNTLPTHSYFRYTLSQQIFTSTEVGNAGNITAVAFKVSNSKSTTRNVDIYLSHTSKNSFSSKTDWLPQSTDYRVFSGNVTFQASGWTTITLDTPFEYNGTSNLLLTVDDNTGSYVSSESNSPKFYIYSTTGYTSLGKYNDYTDYNPSSMSASGTRAQTNNQVVFTKEVSNTPSSLSVSPNALSGFTYGVGEGPSAPQCIAVIGVKPTTNITVTAPTHFEISTTPEGSYQSSLTLTQSNLLTANVYIRLKAGLSVGTFANETLAVTSGNLNSNITLSGEVLPQIFTKPIPAYNTTGGYYLIASPIGEVSPANVTHMLENTYDLYYFDQTGGDDGTEWKNWKQTGDHFHFNLEPGKGYLYANSQNDTLTFTGIPYSNGQVTLSKTSGTHFEGWNLVGNPFAQTAYITKPFYTINPVTSEVIPGTGNSIGAMEGIFVVADVDGETMTFSTEEPERSAALVMNLNRDHGTSIDRAIIRFGEESDLPKFMLNKNNTMLYIPQNNQDYAVVSVGRDAAFHVSTMDVNFKAAENGTYTLSFSIENVVFDYLHLIDTMTGADVDLVPLLRGQGGLNQPASYTFTAKTTDNESRFKLVFSVDKTDGMTQKTMVE